MKKIVNLLLFISLLLTSYVTPAQEILGGAANVDAPPRVQVNKYDTLETAVEVSLLIGGFYWLCFGLRKEPPL